MKIEYIGEHILPGTIGTFFVALAFSCILFSCISYYLAGRHRDPAWTGLARVFFRVHGLSVLGIGATLFYIIFNHYYEYNYAYQHSSDDLPFRYMLSCFWEGQEGSFLLWIFWHSVLGTVLISRRPLWEEQVMAIFTSVQVLLASMLLGIYVFGIKIGSNPFMLLRENPEMMNIPVFKNPEYLNLVEGRGLNPLLQNYWMTIHPPTLFLGFASTLIPFSYAMASLWRKSYWDWLRPVLPWTYFGILVLGTGVLMGGAWAYEALSFGGFWAWDPVENASLVPWLFFVAAAHLMLINRSKREKANSLFTTYAVTILTFLMVLYSTYLTRSGILGESSVHSFAEGMPGQLIVFMSLYIIFSVAMLAFRFRDIPRPKEEETFLSREFWLFIGALVLLISAFQITFTTSIPVINAIFGTSMAPPVNAVNHYNSWQIPFATIVAILMAFGQFLNYRKSDGKSVLKKLALPLAVSLFFSIGIAIGLEIRHGILIFILFASLFAVLANADYWIRILKGRIKNAGASIAHIGFGLILLGALLSAGLQKTISVNTSGIDIRMKDEEKNANMENILLYRNDSLPMGPYLVSYAGSSRNGVNINYEVTYVPRNDRGQKFSLYPRIQVNKIMGNVPEPDTKHFWNKDLFTFISYVNKQEFDEVPAKKFAIQDTLYMKSGDSAVVKPYLVILRGISRDVDRDKLKIGKEDIAVKAILEFDDLHGNITVLEPALVVSDNKLYYMQDENDDLGYRIALINVNPKDGMLTFEVEKDENKKEDFIIMKAVIFPYINVLWIGCVIMITGIAIAIYNRLKYRR